MSPLQDEQMEMVKIAVHSRKNDAIVSLLQKAFPLLSFGDTTDGRNDSIFYEVKQNLSETEIKIDTNKKDIKLYQNTHIKSTIIWDFNLLLGSLY